MGIYGDDFTVVVVEDNPAQRKLINKVLLKIDGVQPILCSDTFEAYAIIRALPNLDLVMLDINLPFASGVALLQKLRSIKEYEHLPILLSTAESELPGADAAQANGILNKPYDVSQIKIFIEAFRSPP